MPWDKTSIKKHNRSLSGPEASKASAQANAILEETGNEGMALAVANKNVNRQREKRAKVRQLQRSGMVSERARKRRLFETGDENNVDASTM